MLYFHLFLAVVIGALPMAVIIYIQRIDGDIL